MVVIECPHCNEELEMDDDSFGVFECPYCGGEYEWGEKPKSKISKSTKKTDISKSKKRSNSTTVTTSPNESVMIVESSQILMTLFTVLMMTIILAGLNSDFWYKNSFSSESSQGSDDGSTETQIGYSFSTLTFITSYDDTESYQESTASSDFSNQIESLEENIDEIRGSCSEWGFNDSTCDEMVALQEDTLVLYKSANTAGTILWIFIVLALLCSLGIILLNFWAILDDYQAIQLPDILYHNYSKINTILNLALPTLLILGCLLYWIMMPDTEMLWGVESGEFSYGPGMIWWVTVIISIGYIIKPATTLAKEIF